MEKLCTITITFIRYVSETQWPNVNVRKCFPANLQLQGLGSRKVSTQGKILWGISYVFVFRVQIPPMSTFYCILLRSISWASIIYNITVISIRTVTRGRDLWVIFLHNLSSLFLYIPEIILDIFWDTEYPILNILLILTVLTFEILSHDSLNIVSILHRISFLICML